MANKQDDPTRDPSIPSVGYQRMAPKWAMIEALLGGTATMREAGEDYLPKHSAESQRDYDDRLSTAVLYNVTELTLESLTGRVFREELKLNEDVPEKITTLKDDIDLQKTPISTFCATWFRESLAKGFSHVYIDMPGLSTQEKATRTLADDMKENRRPFWSLIKPENLIFAHHELVNGVNTLLHARVVETKTGMDGFAETTTTFIRVLTPGHWALWQNKYENQPSRKPLWEEVDQGDYDLPVIPIVTFYTGKDGPMQAKLPLEDLGYLNIRHWQSNSDQQNVLTVARFPMLAASGAQVEAGKTAQPIGPRQLLTMRDPNGRFYYVEHSGKAIASGKEELEKLEDQMAAYGAEFLRRQVAGRTAFERAQDTNEAISPLRRMAIEFGKSVEQALAITGMWLNITDTTGTVTVNTEYTEEEEETPVAVAALGDARKRGDLSRRTWLTEMKRRAFVDPTLNVDDEIKELEKEFAEGPHPPTYFQGVDQVKDWTSGDANAQAAAATAAADAAKTKAAKKIKPAAATAAA